MREIKHLTENLENYISYAKKKLEETDVEIVLDSLLKESLNYTSFFLLNTGSEESSYPEPRKLRFIAGLGKKRILANPDLKLKSGKFKFTTISYDLKNSFENLKSENTSFIQHPTFLAVEPEIVISCSLDNYLEVFVDVEEMSAESIIDKVLAKSEGVFRHEKSRVKTEDFKWTASDEEYILTVEKIRQEIENGYVYELNYCRNCVAKEVQINPLKAYRNLLMEQGTPFMAFVKWNDFYCISASMERFLSRFDNKIVSQPIKGTAARSLVFNNEKEEIEDLRKSEKEQAENLMIVDLVRNDLNRLANNNSVKVEELFGIYSYPAVHQMISSISCQSDSDNLLEILKATFPMGSMTGAPKLSAMHLIEKYEDFKRGLYSGSIGYISPKGNFDLNVVIRSLIYDQKERVAQIPVGSAITYDSNAQQELAECKVKIQKILQTIVES